MDTQKTEAQLLHAMASATTQAEQRDLAAELEGLRTAKADRERAVTEEMWAETFMASQRPDPYARALHTTSSRESDWLADVEETVVDTSQADTQMRAQASLWYSRSLSPLAKESAHEILVQADGLATALASQYGEVRTAAYEAFMDQVRHHAATDGKNLKDLSDLPSPYAPGTYGEDTETSASDTPSLEHGEEPEGDKPATGEADVPTNANLDAATWPSDSDWKNGDPAARKTAAEDHEIKAWLNESEWTPEQITDLVGIIKGLGTDDEDAWVRAVQEYDSKKTASRKTAAPKDGQRSYCRICGVEMEGQDYAWYALSASAPKRDVGQHHHLPARNADWPGEFNAQGDLIPGTPGGGGGQYDAPAGTIYDAGGNPIRIARRRRTASPSWLEAARRVVQNHQHETVDGMLLDAFTASALVQVYDALKPENKAKFDSMPLEQAASVAMRLI